MSPEFSVILPTRGDSAHLRAATASVLRCKEDLELLIVHDRRDGEPDLPAELRNAGRVRALATDAPGPAASRNTGLGAVRGRFVAFQDDDDVWLPDHLRKSRQMLDDHSEALLVASDAYLFEDLSADGSTPVPEDPTGLPRFRPGVRESVLGLRDLLLENPILTPTVVLDRDRLEVDERFRAELQVMEDYELWVRLVRRYPLLFDGRPGVVVRRRRGSASADLAGMAELSIRILEQQLAQGLPDGAITAGELRERFGKLWHELAYARLRAGHPAGARSAVRRSLGHLPLKMKNYMYLMFTFLPGPLRRALWTRAGSPRSGRRRGETA